MLWRVRETPKLWQTVREMPWNSWWANEPNWFRSYPTMLTREEMRMLSWAAENAPPGPIVDLGCFLGGSTVSLAVGLRRSGRTDKIHSYDMFHAGENLRKRFFPDFPVDAARPDDCLPAFRHFTSEFSDFLTVNQGDILNEEWLGDEISLLFVDLSKSRSINDHILSNFFTKLKPKSLVIQQDFLFFKDPWLLHSMYKLRKYFEFLSYCQEHSVIFGTKIVPSKREVQAGYAQEMSVSDIKEAAEYFLALFPHARQREMIRATVASFEASPKAQKEWDFGNPLNLPYRMVDRN